MAGLEVSRAVEMRGGRRTWLTAAGAGTAIYLACATVAARGQVPAWEKSTFHAVNGLPDALRVLAYPVQLLGVLVVPLVLAVVAVVVRRWRLAIAVAMVPVLKLALEYGVVKQTVQRARPFQSVCDEDPSCGVFRDVPLYGPSFVSGHAMVAAAVAVLVLPYLPRRWGVPVVTVAACVALARVYLGAHNPLDVVGGAALGVVIGSLLNLVLRVPGAMSTQPS